MEENIDNESDNLHDEDLLNLDHANQMALDQENLTPEEKEEIITKSLNANNPQAPKNITLYSRKDHHFKKDEIVEQLVIHFSFDGDIIIKDSEEARDQEDYWDQKNSDNKRLLDKMNKAISDEYGSVDEDDLTQKKSLRN